MRSAINARTDTQRHQFSLQPKTGLPLRHGILKIQDHSLHWSPCKTVFLNQCRKTGERQSQRSRNPSEILREKKITKKTIKKQPPHTSSFSQVSLQQTSHLTDSPIYLLSWLDHTFALLFYTTGHCISGTRFTPSKPRTFCLAESPPPEGYPTQRYPEMGNLPSPPGMCSSG